MSLPSKIFKLQKNSLDKILHDLEKTGLMILKSRSEIRISNSEDKGGILIGMEFEGCEDYICVVTVTMSPPMLKLFHLVCEKINDNGGLEVKGGDMPVK